MYEICVATREGSFVTELAPALDFAYAAMYHWIAVFEERGEKVTKRGVWNV